MHKLASYIIDFIFPPSHLELELRSLSPQNALGSLPKANKPEFPFISAIFDYKNDLVREMIWQIKYKKNRHAIHCSAYALCARLENNLILIPIPISKKRRKERGFNQCELLIDEILKFNPNLKKNFNLLIRSKDIDRQTFKDRNERIENIRNVFEVTGALSATADLASWRGQSRDCSRLRALQNKIVVIDDVTTTGSTLREARETLLKAGFMNVETMAVAH